MQSVSSRIWTRVDVSISYDDNHYTTGTSNLLPVIEYFKRSPFTIFRFFYEFTVEYLAIKRKILQKNQLTEWADLYIDLLYKLIFKVMNVPAGTLNMIW